MRVLKTAVGEYYHIYNRGVEKRNIFANNDDLWRFMTLLIIFQGKIYIPQVSRLVTYVKHWMFDKDIFEEIISERTVELVCFCLMPNHFHLILKEIKEGGIPSFMQRLGDAYTKYFNLKYKRTGHLFGAKYQSVHINKDSYLKYLSAYIHINPREIISWTKKEHLYPWSSFQDYIKTNRWNKFLNPSIILEQFKNQKHYLDYVSNSNIKKKSGLDILID